MHVVSRCKSLKGQTKECKALCSHFGIGGKVTSYMPHYFSCFFMRLYTLSLVPHIVTPLLYMIFFLKPTPKSYTLQFFCQSVFFSVQANIFYKFNLCRAKPFLFYNLYLKHITFLVKLLTFKSCPPFREKTQLLITVLHSFLLFFCANFMWSYILELKIIWIIR